MVDIEDWEFEENNDAKKNCPVNIIDIKKIGYEV